MNEKTVYKFIEAINQQDLSQIIEMMAADFVFIGTYGNSEGKEQMKSGWQGYFEWFPDYKIEADEYIENEDFSVVLGKASGSYLGNSEKYWLFPAAWKVITSGEHIQLWQIFCDSKKQLDSMK